ncbi:aminotransferase [Microbacterium thalassium]|uniref:4-aminobutyrate aminotransferase-like enzyme/Ser/Thr protein kinase RdoA (MazF antagonist) n=1 Tax=Microbacterium thalassium TaxID=362649 RepID=A0A7X0KVV7_9MICO|nr:aminotransferase [Microbacterium thalassium]MBB6392479.1 4-aminobutyrate aminotransferase-like enzyme/Ser/Thr protein kinase RdoA (MazF antagonist) [Microbacterium thalassium]GLK23289.1 4-aminobutyrate aminotransferase [Microbacterium thalassium]
MSSSTPQAPGLVQATPPAVDDETAAGIALDGWGVAGRARPLGSNQDRNFLIEREDGPALLLKIANPSTTVPELEAQSAAADLIAARAGTRAPRAHRRPGGGTTLAVPISGVVMHARLLDFLPGETLSGYLSPAVVSALGALAARVAQALSALALPGADRAHQWDLRRAPDVLAELLPAVPDDAARRRLADAAGAAARALAPVVGDLPVQAIHGDLTDDNVVRSDPLTRLPDGVIDLGDLGRSWAVAELAITVSSLLHHDGVDLAAAMRAVTAYHRERPLSDAEQTALWPLVVQRGAVLVASAHQVLSGDPGNGYAAENLAHERAIFDRAVSVPLEVATALVRAATGHAPAPLALPAARPLIDTDAPHVVDLSPASALLDDGRWLRAETEDAAFAAAPQGAVAAARFGESRLTRAVPLDPEPPRIVSLGVELATPSGAPLLAPWAGTVAPTPSGFVLTAHGVRLIVDGCRLIEPAGSAVVAGDRVAEPAGRVWVQVVREGVDAPRFAPRSLAAAWTAVVADPSPLVPGLEPAPAPLDAARLLERRDAVFAEVQEHYYDAPPVMVRGWRELLVDAEGRVYLDTLNNVTAVGHSHPRLADAVDRQWRLLNTNSRFHYPAVVEFSERLAELVPDPLDTVFLVNSGSEAVDLSLRLARGWSGRPDVVAVEEAYHGWTYLTDAVSTSTADNPAALETRPAWVHTVPSPHPFRGPHADAPERYAADAADEIARLAAAGSPVGAFVAETAFGNGGGMFLPDGYLARVYDAVRTHGGLAIADEVQVGYGRLGEWFWGFQQQDAVPDIVAVAKSMGNGHPLGAVITTREVAARYRTGGYFFSSAGGSPVSSVVGLTVLDIMRDEDLVGNARRVGGALRERLLALGDRHPILAAVHGAGLYLGPEFVRDRETWEPATAETAAICRRLRDLGVIAQPTGDHQNILKIKPPLCFGEDSADALVAALDRVLTEGW